MQSTKANTKISSARIPQAQKTKPAAAAAVSTPSTSEVETSAVAPLEVEAAAVDKAAAVQAKAPLLALEGWGLVSYSSSDDEEEAAKPKPAAGAKKGKATSSNKTAAAKSRTPSKEKYLLSAAKKITAQQDKKAKPEDDLFTAGATAGFGDELLSSFDPFADADDASTAAARGGGGGAAVHLRLQQRNGRKSLTTVQGISAAYNYAKILRDLKRELCCNGIVVEDEDLGSVIQLQGDHRKAAAAFIVKAGMAAKANVKIHGA